MTREQHFYDGREQWESSIGNFSLINDTNSQFKNTFGDWWATGSCILPLVKFSDQFAFFPWHVRVENREAQRSTNGSRGWWNWEGRHEMMGEGKERWGMDSNPMPFYACRTASLGFLRVAYKSAVGEEIVYAFQARTALAHWTPFSVRPKSEAFRRASSSGSMKLQLVREEDEGQLSLNDRIRKSIHWARQEKVATDVEARFETIRVLVMGVPGKKEREEEEILLGEVSVARMVEDQSLSWEEFGKFEGRVSWNGNICAGAEDLDQDFIWEDVDRWEPRAVVDQSYDYE
ncbi:hypothetical protein EDD18DRAFT_1098939 [Armillaria luteobubalina]|uniref:Uncharacterized protein n=1 Tax=Armillaria luteobubalina TaxID=153913 RepID=A0AA39UVV6_9AGAR|nr:hypothetical protein EDD18DRAFT_1098939 [Armillaria luteobubalina]